MKYGLMYYKATDNIGDDIQTYVAKKYLPHIDYYIDRESLSCFVPEEKEYISMIMNGWYIHNKIAWPPSPYINPLLISMHFKSLEDTDVGDIYLKELGGDFLKKYGPVGARDIETKKRLENNGIDAYFSGCMTLTIEKFKNIEKKNKIILVDVEEEVIEKVKKTINNMDEIKRDTNNTNKVKESYENMGYEIEVLSHYLNPEETENKTIEERMKDVENLLKKYQEAHLVITSRLHVALPCVALETPVIVLHNELFDKDRLGTFFDLMDNYTITDFLQINLEDILKNPKPNNRKYIEIKNSINKRCKEFINQCEAVHLSDQKLCVKDLPEIEDYKKYTNNIKWYKEIYEKERQALEKLEKRRVAEFYRYSDDIKSLNQQKEEMGLQKDELNQELNLLKIEKENYQNQNELLKRELYNIYHSKGWKYLEKIRKLALR